MQGFINDLKNMDLFNNLSDFELLDFLLSCDAKIFECPAHNYFNKKEHATEGHPSICLILAGRMTMLLETQTDTQHFLRPLNPGDVFESGALLQTKKTPVLYWVEDDAVVLTILWQGLTMAQEPKRPHRYQVMHNLLFALESHYMFLKQKIAAMGARTVRAKIVFFLRAMWLYTGSTQFLIEYSRVELANYFNVSREALSREFMKMQQEKLIEMNRETIRILNLNLLFTPDNKTKDIMPAERISLEDFFEPPYDALQMIPLFENVKPQEAYKLLQALSSSVAIMHKNDKLILNPKSTCFYIIVQGAVRECFCLSNTHQTYGLCFSAGDILGEEMCLGSLSQSGPVFEIIEDVILLEVPFVLFDLLKKQARKESGDLLMSCCRGVCHKSYRAEQLIELLLCGSVREKAAKYLFSQINVQNPQRPILLPSIKELAGRLSVSRPALSTVLHKMEHEKAIKFTPEGVCVENADLLVL